MKKKNEKVILYDTTLRDGNQDQRVNLTLKDKLLIARILADFGICFIEGGWPGSNRIDSQFFKQANKLAFSSRIVAFGSTVKPGVKASVDLNLKSLIGANTVYVTIFGKAWDYQVKRVLGISLAENLKLIKASVKFLRSQGRSVFFDAEHFFDGYKANPRYALNCALVAQEAGADVVTLCDTNGGCFPIEIQKIVTATKKQIKVDLGIHCHNDNGLAVANSLEAARVGAIYIQGTFNGYGERCGNADLVQIIPNLIKQGIACLPKGKLADLTRVAKEIAEITEVKCQPNQPFVGRNAFCHKGGTHQHAVARDPRTFEHISPEAIGNSRFFTNSDQSGRSYVFDKLLRSGFFPKLKNKKELFVDQVLNVWKKRANDGYRFDLAEASAFLAARRLEENSRHPFLLKRFEINVGDKQEQAVSLGSFIASSNIEECEAVVEIEVFNGYEYASQHVVGKGDGPVNALDIACRKALELYFPIIKKVKLSDFRVRVLPGKREGTAAKVSVIIESTSDGCAWRTVGVSENIFRASLIALLESYEYAVMGCS